MAKLLLIEPYYAGSHKSWADGIVEHSSHDVTLLSLPGRHWKWRMEGASYTIAEQMLAMKELPDLVWVSDMINLESLRWLTRERYSHIAFCIYFHENQLTYPIKSKSETDFHYGFINIKSAYAADYVYFNSDYNRLSFLEAAKQFLNILPKPKIDFLLEKIASSSSVLPVGINLKKLPLAINKKPSDIKSIIWNHRWEHDKNPVSFFEALFRLQEENIDFRLVVLGEQFEKVPPIFKLAKERLMHKILHWGHVKDKSEYYRWLMRGDISYITSNHEFFGLSAVEAAYYGNQVLAPHRLSYPEVLGNVASYYDTDTEGYQMLKDLLKKNRPNADTTSKSYIDKYQWSNLIERYDLEIKKGSL